MLRPSSFIRVVLGICFTFLLFTPVLAHVVTVPASPSEKSAGVTAEAIAANPTPNVILVDDADESVYNRAYRRVLGNFQIMDAAGSLLEDRGKGFVYVTAGRGENGLSSIGGGRYVSAENLSSNVQISKFTGFLFPDEPLEYTPAWVVQKVRPSAHPGEAESPTEEVLERYTLVNLLPMSNWMASAGIRLAKIAGCTSLTSRKSCRLRALPRWKHKNGSALICMSK
jgi:hypothetical protein